MADQEAAPGIGPQRWPFLQLHPLMMRVPGDPDGISRWPVFSAFALMVAGLAVALIPGHIETTALGGLTDAGSSTVYAPALCFLVGDVCLAAGVWAAVRAARDRPLERIIVAGLGLVSAALAGHSVRVMLQVILLRRFYQPTLLFTSPARAAAVCWGFLLTAMLVAGFLAPVLVSVANLLPKVLTMRLRPARWLTGCRWWLLLPFATLAATVIITQWVLPASLANAMGYSFPLPSGELVTISLRNLGPATWTSFQILFALPLLVLMWEGTEAARSCQRLVRKPKGGETALLTRLRSVDYRFAAAIAVAGVVWLAVAKRDVLTAFAGAALAFVIALSFRGELGRAVRLTKSFERQVRKWQLPEGWLDVGRISLLLVILVFPVIVLLTGDIGLGLKEGLWFPPDASGFYFYWHDYGLVAVPVVSASGIYGHTEAVIWAGGFGLAAITFVGFLIQRFKDGRVGFRIIWFFLRVGVLAFLLAPLARLADHDYATFILAGGAVLAVLVASRSPVRPAAVWSAIIMGGALTLWSLALWHLTWLPAAALLCFTIVQRFVYNAGELNEPGEHRYNRVAYFQAIALIAVAMLVLGHGAPTGYFSSDALSSVADRVSLSMVAVTWLVMLVIRQTRAAGEGTAADDIAAQELPRSWAWLLEPGHALVRFTGREKELAALLAWCEDERAEPLRLVNGPGGTGKTRLAAELARRLAERGWEAAWVSDGQEGLVLDRAGAPPGSRSLFIVDNADTRTGLGSMLATLVSSQGPGVRVLLLARSVGGWLDYLSVESPAVRSLVQLTRQERLFLATSIDADRPDHKLVAQAVGSIAEEFGLGKVRVETRYKTGAARQPVLELHAAALVATLTDASLTETGTGTVQADIRAGGLGQLLTHERQFWSQSARDQGLLGAGKSAGKEVTEPLLRQVIAASCLFGARSTDEARELAAARIPGIGPPGEIDGWLQDLRTATHSGSAGTTVLSGRLAELHTLRELAASAQFSEACLTGLTAGQAAQLVTFLARACTDYREATTLLGQVLPEMASRITGPWSAAHTLPAILNALPCPSAVVAPVAVTLIRQLLDVLPARTEPTAHAYWLSNLGLRLTETGDLSGALAAERDTGTVYAELAAAEPDWYLPDLAASLQRRSDLLGRLDQPDEALSAAEEAVAVCRWRLTADPRGGQQLLGPALANLSLRYQKAGRADDAMSATEEAVSVYRNLLLSNQFQHRPGLARALTRLGLQYYQRGRFAEALPVADEGVTVYRDIVTTNPDDYRPGLAGALDNLGVYLSKLGRPVDALPVTKEAVTLYRQLARANPKRYGPDLTRAQGNLRVRHRELASRKKKQRT